MAVADRHPSSFVCISPSISHVLQSLQCTSKYSVFSDKLTEWWWGSYDDEQSWKCGWSALRECFHHDVQSTTRHTGNSQGHNPHTSSRNYHLFSCDMPASTRRVTRSQSKRKVISFSSQPRCETGPTPSPDCGFHTTYYCRGIR